MKKLFFIAGVALSLSVAAQTEKGSWMLGTNFSNLNIKIPNGGDASFSFNVEPKMAYFISNEFGLGARVKLGFDKPGVGDGTFQYGIEPLARYYFTSVGEKGKLFAQGSLGVDGKSTKGQSESAFTFAIGAGWNWFFSKYTALELGLEYRNYPDTKLSNIGLNFGINVFLPHSKASSVKSSYRNR